MKNAPKTDWSQETVSRLLMEGHERQRLFGIYTLLNERASSLIDLALAGKASVTDARYARQSATEAFDRWNDYAQRTLTLEASE